MDQIFLCTLSDLNEFFNGLEDRLLKNLTKQSKSEHFAKEWLTPNEVAEHLKISLTTVHTWSNQGILVKHKIGRKTRFKKEEVLSALTQLETKKSKSWKR